MPAINSISSYHDSSCSFLSDFPFVNSHAAVCVCRLILINSGQLFRYSFQLAVCNSFRCEHDSRDWTNRLGATCLLCRFSNVFSLEQTNLYRGETVHSGLILESSIEFILTYPGGAHKGRCSCRWSQCGYWTVQVGRNEETGRFGGPAWNDESRWE